MKSIDNILHISDDERILGIQESTKKVNVLQNVYSNLTYPLLYTNPSLLSSVSLRMVELTIFKGLSSASPMGFVYYGQMMMAMGRLKDGCRLGRLSLKLCEIKNCSQHKSGVIFFVSQFISWAAISFQSIVDAHSLGRKCENEYPFFVYRFPCLTLVQSYMQAAVSRATSSPPMSIGVCASTQTTSQAPSYTLFERN